MASRERHRTDWTERGHFERAAAADRLRGERARALIAAAQARMALAVPQPLMRPGVSAPTALRYATTSEPQRWVDFSAGRAIINAIGDSALDGADRIVFAWPSRLGGSFVTAALALLEARASGTLAHATFGYWPWRNGATWAGRSILVHPADLRVVAQRIYTEAHGGAAWADNSIAHEDRAIVEFRLGELFKGNVLHGPGHARDEQIVVRSPNLLEMTTVFPPGEAGQDPYKADADQVLYRVRRHTIIGKLDLRERLAAVGDPTRTPFALLGLPPARKPEALQPFLRHSRVVQRGLDVVVVDLTQRARQSLSDDWEKPFADLVSALDTVSGRRPPMTVIVEGAHALNVATRVLRAHNAALSPKRSFAIELGAYLAQPGVLGPAAELPSDLPPVSFDPDIKDASLAPIRKGLLSLGTALREQGGSEAVAAVARALRFLRRAASLPVGLAEARCIADILHTDDDDVDRSARSAFRPKMELDPLHKVADLVPALGVEAKRLAAEIEVKAESWADETPVSAKLTTVLDAADRRAANIMIAVPSEAIRDIFLSSDRAQRWDCEVVAPNNLAGRLAAAHPERLVVVGTSPEIVRVLLTSTFVPGSVALIGDTAGVGLLSSEIRPITRIDAFRPLAARAEALRAALAESGGDESLDLAEAEFRVKATVPEGEVDFTRSGEDYRGDIVHIVTARGSRFAYRPNGGVLLQSAGELRPFVRRDARHIQAGDFILALANDVRGTLSHALSGSRRIQQGLKTYHDYIAQVRSSLRGVTFADKARYVVAKMQGIEQSIPDSEVNNVRRWITADIAECDADGYRMPGAARDWRRFSIFAQAIGMPELLAKMYWQVAVVPTRAYRAQEGHGFNQRVVQFVLDPESTAIGAGVFSRLPGLWQLVQTAVDEVVSVTVDHRGGSSGHA